MSRTKRVTGGGILTALADIAVVSVKLRTFAQSLPAGTAARREARAVGEGLMPGGRRGYPAAVV